MDNKEISLKEIVGIIRKQWKVVVSFVFVCTFSSYIICLFLPKIYRAEVVIMPGGGGGGMSLMVNPLAGIPMLGGAMSALGWGASNKLSLILKSRTLRERFVERFDLVDELFPQLWDKEKKEWKLKGSQRIPTVEAAAGVLSGMIGVREDLTTSTLALEVESEDPELAADIANKLVDELDGFIQDHEFTKAKRNRLFVEQQLIENRRELLESGRTLMEYYERNSISASLPKVDVEIGINGSLSSSPPKYAFVEGSVSEQKSDVLQDQVSHLTAQKDALREKLKKIEVVKNIPPQLHLEYLSLHKQTLQVLNSLLSQQYAMAKVQEADELIFFTIIDNARVPGGPAKPRTRLSMAVTFILSFFLVIFGVLFREFYRKSS